MARFGSLSHAARKSAYPPGAVIQTGDVCFAPDYFRFTLRSRPFLRVPQTAAVDPTRTLGGAEFSIRGAEIDGLAISFKIILYIC